MPTKAGARRGSKSKSHTLGFKGYINTAPPPLPIVLPLVHMTDAFGARKILESGKIEPNECKHFTALLGATEPLSFFFYGRAGYRPRTNSPTKNFAKYPVALIIAFDPVEHPIKRIFPFDTGAAFEKMYGDFLHDRMSVMDFCLGDGVEAAQGSVARFFQTNENYSKDAAVQAIDYDPAEFEIASYHNMIRNTADLTVDNRKSSIEVQFQKTIDLNKTKVLGIVLPESLMESMQFQTMVKSFGVTPSWYIMPGGSTTEYDGVLIAESTKLLRGYL